jgi:hypothetical protein
MVTIEGQNTLRKTYPIASISNINYTWAVLGSNPILRDEKPATNQMRSPTLRCRHSLMGLFLELLMNEDKMEYVPRTGEVTHV